MQLLCDFLHDNALYSLVREAHFIKRFGEAVVKLVARLRTRDILYRERFGIFVERFFFFELHSSIT